MLGCFLFRKFKTFNELWFLLKVARVLPIYKDQNLVLPKLKKP